MEIIGKIFELLDAGCTWNESANIINYSKKEQEKFIKEKIREKELEVIKIKKLLITG